MNFKLILPVVIALGSFGWCIKGYSDAGFKELETSKKVVRLYPNPTTNGNISVSSFTNEPVYFYVFDEEGTLLHRVILKGKQKKTINDLKKGTYVYDVFLNDISVEQGKIVAK